MPPTFKNVHQKGKSIILRVVEVSIISQSRYCIFFRIRHIRSKYIAHPCLPAATGCHFEPSWPYVGVTSVLRESTTPNVRPHSARKLHYIVYSICGTHYGKIHKKYSCGLCKNETLLLFFFLECGTN